MSPAPVLVTGLPRSGTTWLAQQLATARRTALPGREPMNPRERQFALQGSVSGWVRLDECTGDRQRRALRRVYRGWEPRAYSRYGVRQWAAPLPWVRVVVKDPFALLSLPYLSTTTGAEPVVLFRHPAALLASYRRMGWRPDVAEIRDAGLAGPYSPVPPADDEVASMGWFWATCYAAVLRDLPRVPGAVVVSHAELAGGGRAALTALADRLGLRDLRASAAVEHRPTRRARGIGHDGHAGGDEPRLHLLDRVPSEVAEEWRRHVSADEVAHLESLTAPVMRPLTGRRLRLRAQGGTDADVAR
jgi:Sulfotransferase family